MSYNYAQLRAALANGPTPGPRSINEVGDSHRIVVRGGSVSGVMAFVETGWPHPEQQSEQRANALLIAAANPETIFALLAERDAQAAEIEQLREALQKVRPVIAADRQGLLDCHGIHGKIPAEDELGTYGLYEYDGALHVIDSALSGETT